VNKKNQKLEENQQQSRTEVKVVCEQEQKLSFIKLRERKKLNFINTQRSQQRQLNYTKVIKNYHNKSKERRKKKQ